MDTYFIRGSHPETFAASLEGALAQLVQLWLGAASLRPHIPGNLVIQLGYEGRAVTIEITDETVLRGLVTSAGPMAVIEFIAQAMGVEAQDALSLLDGCTARARVDVLYHSQAQWQPGVHPAKGEGGEDVVTAMPRETPHILSAMVKRHEQATGRETRRKRDREGQALVDMALRLGKKLGLSDTALSKQTGIPRSTLRDARIRSGQDRGVFKGRKPGQPFVTKDRERILAEIRATKGNAAAAARRLGLPERTVREIRGRAEREAAAQKTTPDAVVPSARTHYSAEDRERLTSALQERIQKGQSASEAARELGIRERTARQWVREEKIKILD